MPSRTSSAVSSNTPRVASSTLLVAGLIAAITVVAYLPALQGGLIWDDDAHVTRPELRSAEGLYRIWFDLGSTQQYYPLLHSAFWLQHKLWGDRPIGYHVVNLALHLFAAGLVFIVVRRLLVERHATWAESAALITAAAFALHPVHVESVAWITEQKNTLSAVFYLAAMLIYLRFDATRRVGPYALATGFFVLGLLTKTVTATLPAALLVIFWWKNGRLSMRRDGWPLMPWFALGAAAGLFTAWIEHDLIGAKGAAFEHGAVERFLLAGRVVWFYLSKLFWPVDLTFIYPRWSVNAADWRQWLYPITLIVLFVVLAARSRKSRAPLAGLLFFVGSLFPVLGFLNVYPFLFSYVADHFQYLPSLGVLMLVGTALAAGLSRMASPLPRLAVVLVLCAALATLTYRQSSMYRDVRTLYETTIARNPSAWMAFNNLGVVLKGEGHIDEAMDHYRRAIELRHDYPEAWSNLGVALSESGRYEEAIAAHRESLRIRSANPEALSNLAAALSRAGRHSEAIDAMQQALQYDPRNAALHRNFGVTLHAAGRTADAVAAYRRSLELHPEQPEVRTQMILALASSQSPEQAIVSYQRILKDDPTNAQAHFNLAVLLTNLGQSQEAIRHYEQVVALRPDHLEARTNLATLLARSGRVSEAIPHFEQAARLGPGRVEMHMNLAVAYASAERFADAMASATKARELAQTGGPPEVVARIDEWMADCLRRERSTKGR